MLEIVALKQLYSRLRNTQRKTRLNTERGNHKTRHSWGKGGRNTRATGEHNQTDRRENRQKATGKTGGEHFSK